MASEKDWRMMDSLSAECLINNSMRCLMRVKIQLPSISFQFVLRISNLTTDLSQANLLASEVLQRLILEKQKLTSERDQLLAKRNQLVERLPMLEERIAQMDNLDARLQQSEQDRITHS